MNILKVFIFIGALIFTASPVIAGPILVDPHTGKYLGNLNSNKFDPNSVANPYGKYGSKFSPDSINNPYGKYGSKFSPDSATNPYGNGGPIIVDPGHGYNVGDH